MIDDIESRLKKMSNQDIVRKMSNQELAKWLHHCSEKYYCDDCSLFDESDMYCTCQNALMGEASTRLLIWNPNVNNEFFKERCE